MENKDLLIVIDMQNVYREGEAWGCCRAGKALQNIIKLLESGAFEDVVFTRFDAPSDPEGSWKEYNRVNKAINEDQRLNEMMEELKPYSGRYPVLSKSTYSSFEIPELCDMAKKADHVVLTGVVAECCVLATAMSAIDKGFPVIYLSDAVSGLSPETEKEAEHVVSYLAPVQTEVMSTEEYIRRHAHLHSCGTRANVHPSDNTACTGAAEHNKNVNIAIDGPSGVGKSTTAKELARRLGFTYIDTGAMFRTLAVYFIRKGLDINDEESIVASLPECSVDISYEEGKQHMILNGEDVTELIRTEEVSHAASVTSSYAGVRKKLLEMQREMARSHDVIMDGRDIGTVVLPGAQLKLFISARPEVRAKRRYDQLMAGGKLGGATLESILKDMEERDYRDSHRANAPLMKAEDAVLLDNSDMTEEEVLEAIISMLRDRKLID